jgi:hypothetical protein
MRLLVLVPLVTLLACSTTHAARNDGFVRPVMEGGQLQWHRDGQVYPHGLGGGLVDAVRDDPEALAHAEFHRSRNLAGLGLLVGTVVAVVAGGAVVENTDSTRGTAVGFGLLGVGALLYGGGIYSLATGGPRLYDAVNAYNDGVLDWRAREARPE